MDYPEKLKGLLQSLKSETDNDKIADLLWDLKVWWDENKPSFRLDDENFGVLLEFSKEDQHIFKAESAFYAIAAVNPEWIKLNQEEVFNHPLWNVRLAGYECLILHSENRTDVLNKLFFNEVQEETQVKWFLLLFYLQEIDKIELEFFEKLKHTSELKNQIVGSFALATRNPKSELAELKKLILQGLAQNGTEHEETALYAANFLFIIPDETIVDLLLEFQSEIVKNKPEYNIFHTPEITKTIKKNFQSKFIEKIKDLNDAQINSILEIFDEKDKPELTKHYEKASDPSIKEKYGKIINSIKGSDKMIKVDGVDLEI